MKFAIKKPMMLPALDFDDHIPTKLPSVFTLKWLLNMVSDNGKDVNWKNPKDPKLTRRNKYMPNEGLESYISPFKKQTIGTRE